MAAVDRQAAKALSEKAALVLAAAALRAQQSCDDRENRPPRKQRKEPLRLKADAKVEIGERAVPVRWASQERDSQELLQPEPGLPA